jgi:hypothetical protein
VHEIGVGPNTRKKIVKTVQWHGGKKKKLRVIIVFEIVFETVLIGRVDDTGRASESALVPAYVEQALEDETEAQGAQPRSDCSALL